MLRLAQNDLLLWFQAKGRKPLIMRGARQVGKSTLVRNFCHAHHLELLELNLEERPLKSLDQSGYSLEEIIQEIEYFTEKKILPKKSLVFIDEIQEQPKAINLLRYFYEKRPDIAVIAAGSLLEIMLKHEKMEFPVGRVDFYQLGPMTFYEFLLALGEKKIAEYLIPKDGDSFQPIPTFVHDELIKKLRTYFLVGGMPEAVLNFAENKSFEAVGKIQQQILETYRHDFFKYATSAKIPKLGKVFEYVPTRLGQKIKYVEIARDFKSKDLQEAIQILTDARILGQVCYTSGKSLPLKSESDSSIFKLYFLDIGLCSKLNNLNLDTFLDEENLSIYLKGALAEQFVFQHLAYGHGKFEAHTLYYWLNEKKNASAEIDFLAQFKLGKKQTIVPIEVKSGSSQKLKSLHHFLHKSKLSIAFKLSPEPYSEEKLKAKFFDGVQNVEKKFTLFNIPLYWVEQLEQLLQN